VAVREGLPFRPAKVASRLSETTRFLAPVGEVILGQRGKPPIA